MDLLNNKILALMLQDINTGFHASQIAKSLKFNQKTVSNKLNNLKKEGLLTSQLIGKNKTFKIIKSTPFLLNIESEKTILFLRDNFKISQILEKLNLKDPHLIFGSYAKGLQKNTSDLDILIIGNYDNKRIEEVSKIFDIIINIKSVEKESFIKSIKNKDYLTNEIIKDHIIISGFEFFIEFFS